MSFLHHGWYNILLGLRVIWIYAYFILCIDNVEQINNEYKYSLKEGVKVGQRWYMD